MISKVALVLALLPDTGFAQAPVQKASPSADTHRYAHLDEVRNILGDLGGMCGALPDSAR